MNPTTPQLQPPPEHYLPMAVSPYLCLENDPTSNIPSSDYVYGESSSSHPQFFFSFDFVPSVGHPD